MFLKPGGSGVGDALQGGGGTVDAPPAAKAPVPAPKAPVPGPKKGSGGSDY